MMMPQPHNIVLPFNDFVLPTIRGLSKCDAVCVRQQNGGGQCGRKAGVLLLLIRRQCQKIVYEDRIGARESLEQFDLRYI
jgi:hypothetical protein